LNFHDRFSEKLNIKFHENPSGWRRVVEYDGETDLTKITVAFRKFAKVLKKKRSRQIQWYHFNYSTILRTATCFNHTVHHYVISCYKIYILKCQTLQLQRLLTYNWGLNVFVYIHRRKQNKILYFKGFIAQTVYTGCIRMNYKIVPVTNLNIIYNMVQVEMNNMYRVIQNVFRGFNKFSYTIHLI